MLVGLNISETKCDSSEEFKIRKEKIISHINLQYYPKLTTDEKNALKSVAESFYERISNELPKSIIIKENRRNTCKRY